MSPQQPRPRLKDKVERSKREPPPYAYEARPSPEKGEPYLGEGLPMVRDRMVRNPWEQGTIKGMLAGKQVKTRV